MREILFRGKTKFHNKWVYGWYCGKILSEDMSRTEESSQIIDAKTLYWHTCEAETVGQFTGLTDKNGKKIFEGDIVQCVRTHCDGEEMIGHITFYDCCFCVKEKKSINQPAMDLCGDFEVIGNIHDNPELLEASHD